MPFVGDVGLERAAAWAVAADAQAERDRDAGRVSDNDVWKAHQRALAANNAAGAARYQYSGSSSGWLPRPAQATHLTDWENPMSSMSFRTTGTTSAGFTTQASGFTGPAGLSQVPETARDLRAQARQADALAEQLQLLTGVISDWRGGLADRLAAAGWGTTAISEAADALTGTGEDMSALQDGLAGLVQACQDAIAVGAEAAARAATGAAEAFQAQ